MSSSARSSNSPERRRAVGVAGASAGGADVLVLAAQVGSVVGKLGLNLVCGGLGGVMGAACRGFHEAVLAKPGGPVAIGILPGEDPAVANPWCDVVVATGLGLARNALVARSADVLVAIGGGSGTLSEIAFAWQIGRPIVALVPSGGWAQMLAGEAIDDRRDDRVHAAHSVEQVEEALRKLLSLP